MKILKNYVGWVLIQDIVVLLQGRSVDVRLLSVRNAGGGEWAGCTRCVSNALLDSVLTVLCIFERNVAEGMFLYCYEVIVFTVECRYALSGGL